MDMSNSSRPPAMSTFPDLMNDPALDEREKGFEDIDTCRICHGEAVEPDDPLFYPCKCSGSIKFVHQVCLVEWLAHSQKKHCELCKTPFRFTKLYNPNMPQTLPTPLFIRHAAIQCFRTLVTWLRFLLVAFIWLGWLPWSMRAIWRALFWLADGRWSASGDAQQQLMESSQEGVSQWAGNGTASNAVFSSLASTAANVMTSAASATSLPQASGINFPAGDPLMLTLIKKIIPNLFLPAFSSPAGQNVTSPNGTTGITKNRYPSWLSDVKFLNSLTRYPTINNMIIDMLEGQLITLLVVIAFILLFLIREWVVQQQPMANIAEGEREAAVQLIANDRLNEGVNRANELHEQPNRLNEEETANREARLRQPPVEHEGFYGGHFPNRSATNSPAPSWTDSDDGLPALERDVPRRDVVASDLFSGNAEMDQGRPTFEHSEQMPHAGATMFRDLLARSNGDRGEMLRIIREEGLEDELDWIVNALTGPLDNENVAGPSNQSSQHSANALNEEHDTPAARLPEYEQSPFAADANVASSTGNDLGATDAQDIQDSSDIRDNELPKGVMGRLANWFWGDLNFSEHDVAETLPEDDAHVVQDPAFEDPFVPVQARVEEQPLDVVADAAAADADPDGIEADDFDGIMDLIGMQGPIFGLLQNAVFCALLIAFTVAIGIWLPYLWGKIALVLLANPLELIIGVPMAAVTVIADIALDTLIGVVGYVMYWLSFVCRVVLSPFGAFVPAIDWIPRGKSVTSTSLSLIDASTNRLNKVVKAFLVFHESDIPMFSVISHQALKLHQARIGSVFRFAFDTMKFILHDFPLRLITLGLPGALSFDVDLSFLQKTISQTQQHLGSLFKTPLFNSGSKLMDAGAVGAADVAKATLSVDYDLAVWDTKDRAVAILMGYTLATMVGFLYLRINGLMSGANRGQRVEGIVAEVLLQAGGVMKVILIIGIEMILFPLYCGTLLDLALLPLFSDATVVSRIAFTASSPLTSLFRPLVYRNMLYVPFRLICVLVSEDLAKRDFIRDPDDPTFHPIRDVLERSITTQLRKIGFSAMVYGALVIFCLGGVVWGLYYAFDSVLPIHWSSNAPMLEFPIDLLFYNFVMPLAIQSVKPSDGLHDLYNWWFHKCAHYLRLSNFFFPERHPEEEGHHVRRTWWSLLSGSKGDWEHPVIGEEEQAAAEREHRETYFLRDGRYVRAPASDQVRIPKGTKVFLEVTEDNERVDGSPDPDDGLHGRTSNMFTKVYIPPSFRTRIAAFILLIWLFAAATGVGITIVPLVIGRRIVALYFSSPVPVNDIYAFSCGLCVVGSLAYVALSCHAAVLAMKENPGSYLRSPREVGRVGFDLTLDAGRLLYMSAVLVVLLPTLFAILTELYILIPAHTLMGDGPSHVVHVVQDWTLGVLYVQMAIKLILWHPQSRPAVIFYRIFQDGWLRPDVKVATKALVLPLTLFTAAAVFMPLASVGYCDGRSSMRKSLIYRYAYPATLSVVLAAWTVHLVHRRVAIWRISIRDDVYLIGERLHNFSEKRARDVGVSRRVITG
ncbi:uncharacterized protein N7477_003207 [Penicillium maclennaniae]|uniref:uncharacterized protein n=1 Tax=Penicillium maclennaniae TaxID=1343394 RepID=UPI002540F066|nr:uncharacterized protein N7477_003207 [Penicillium maclennaniae]KAJ5677574.1 hypothetical protein N7477_003207 [Penicillium maclennaniae]